MSRALGTRLQPGTGVLHTQRERQLCVARRPAFHPDAPRRRLCLRDCRPGLEVRGVTPVRSASLALEFQSRKLDPPGAGCVSPLLYIALNRNRHRQHHGVLTPLCWSAISNNTAPLHQFSVMHLAPSHQVIMKADASMCVVSYFPFKKKIMLLRI